MDRQASRAIEHMGRLIEDRRDGVLLLSLDNPPANSVTSAMAAALEAAARAAAGDPELGAVVLAAAGAGPFCAGSDIGELQRLAAEGQGPMPLLQAQAAAFAALAALDLPVVAAVTGAAMGGGVELLLVCDIVLMAEEARLALPEVRIGAFPCLGATARLGRRIGQGRAAELLFTGRSFTAAEAAAWGLAARILPRDEVLPEALRLADRLARGPRAALAGLKRALRAGREMPEAEALAAALDEVRAGRNAAEAAEGMRAFLAGEAPDFARARSRAGG